MGKFISESEASALTGLNAEKNPLGCKNCFSIQYFPKKIYHNDFGSLWVAFEMKGQFLQVEFEIAGQSLWGRF